MKKFYGKDTINVLLNIDNYFGEHSGKMAPVIIFICVASAPLLLWVFLLNFFIKFTYFLPLEIIWTIIWAFEILGETEKKLADYLKQRADEYKSSEELVYIKNIQNDGLIEYSNGVVAYILSGFPKHYLNDNTFSLQLADFMEELDKWNWDIHLHNVVDEILAENNYPKLKEYTDRQVMRDRMDFYYNADEHVRNNTSLYRYNFLVMTSKYSWKKMKNHMFELVESEVANCFNELKVCNREEVEDVQNRDICAFVDFTKMLTKKYENENYHGSEVLWYDNDVPEEYTKERDKVNIEERRVTKDDS